MPAGRGVGGRVAWLSLVGVVVLMPIFTTNFTAFGFAAPVTADQSELPRLALLVLLVCVGIAGWTAAVFRGEAELRWSPAAWWLLAVLGLTGVSVALSVDPSTSFFGAEMRRAGMVGAVAATGAFFLALQVLDRCRRERMLGVASVATGTIVATYGLLQVAGFDAAHWGNVTFEARRAFATLGNPDLFAGFLIAPLALAPVVALTEQNVWRRRLWWCCVAIISSGMLVSLVRGAWIGAVTALVIVAFAVRRSGVRIERVDRIAAVGVLAVLSAIAIGTYAAGALSYSVFERLASLSRLDEGSLHQRQHIWSAALAAIRERPLFGWGPDSFRYAFYAHRPLHDLVFSGYAGVADDAHSLPLQMATTVGLPATAAASVAAWVALASGRRVGFERAGGGSHLVVAGWWAAAIGTIVHLVGGVTSVATTASLLVALGAVAAPAARSVVPRPQAARVVAVFAALAVAVVAVPLALQLRADSLLARSYSATDFAEKERLAAVAADVAPWDHRYLLAEADACAQEARMWDSRSRGGEPGADARIGDCCADATTVYRAVLADVPREARAHIALVHVLAQSARAGTGEYADVLAAADAGLQVYPCSLELRVARAEALAETGELRAAEAELRELQDWDPRDLGPSLLRVEVLRRLGDNASARRLATRLVDDHPGDSAALAALDSVGQETQ